MSGRWAQRISNKPLLRGFAASLAVLTLVAQLLSLAHVAAVSHVTCAEHGESVELSGVTDGEGHHHRGTCIREAAPESDHHDHCVIASFRRERTTTASRLTPQLHVPTFARQRPSSSISKTLASSIALLHLAPKNSPPV